jgi:toxin ParE1/3/4
MFKIVVSPNAAANIEDALDYYLNIGGKNVAENFLKDYRNTYRALKINPFFQYHDQKYRFLPFKKFPFIAFFIVNEQNKTVYINAIFQTSQSTKKYPK